MSAQLMATHSKDLLKYLVPVYAPPTAEDKGHESVLPAL
jgi:hypothetical protein